MRRGEDDDHPRRSEHADQHGRHPALGLEQRLAPRRTQGQVPVVRAAAQHHRLPEVSNETNAPVCCCYESYDGKSSTRMCGVFVIIFCIFISTLLRFEMFKNSTNPFSLFQKKNKAG